MSKKIEDLEKAIAGMISQVRSDLNATRREIHGVGPDGLRKSEGPLRDQLDRIEKRIEKLERNATSTEEPPPLQADTFIFDPPPLLQ
ncbi:MAG TPA: hypothetical protein VMU06_07550 [Stellaceae bacterium]|nr:hypothetical protein [Stellaceae bacterium]